MVFWLHWWQQIHVVEEHILVLLGDRLRGELAHSGIVVVVLWNKRRRRRALAEVLHVAENKITAHLLL